MHRDLRLNSIKVRSKKKQVHLQFGSFDFALQLKKNHTVTQTFNVTRPLAPEIRAGKPHDMAADVWSFGQMAYQLLACPDEEQIIACSENDVKGKVVQE